MELLLQRYLKLFLFLVLTASVSFGQSQPYLSAPVNGSTWETATPTLYWWYVPTPYVYGPYNFTVQLGTSYTDFSESNLLVNANVSAYGAGNYPISNSVGLIQGVTYYWRVGVNGNYSSVWYFTPYGSGSVITYTINASSENHGSISPSGNISIARGSDQAFSIVPDKGYAIEDVEVDDESIGPVASYTFENVTASHSIRASFSFIPVYDTTFVSILGSDFDGDGSRAKPYRRIQRGHDKSKPGHYVYVLNGDYEEDVVLTKPIKIIGQTKPSTNSFIIRANDITIKNFEVTQSSPGPGIQKHGLESYDHLDKLTLENIDAHNNAEMGLLLINIDSVEVKDCNFYGNDMGGITVIMCKYLSFKNVGLEDNIRGFGAYFSDNITIDKLYSRDNGRAYPYYYPDKNGLTFTICNNISLNEVFSQNNQEQGLKFEDCSLIGMSNVFIMDNETDGVAFIKSDQITYNTGTVSNNGGTSDDNGVEIAGCNHVNFSSVNVNGNFNNGFLFDLFYLGVYLWDPSKPINTPPDTTYTGPTNNVTFTDVSANSNGKNGFYGIHLSNVDITDPEFSYNGESGIELDATDGISLLNGTYDYNNNGIALRPTHYVHPVAPKLSTDEITDFSLTGTGSISNNTTNGILVLPTTNSQVTEPLFYGKFNLFNNGMLGLKLVGKVEKPMVSGLYFKSSSGHGIEITDSSLTALVTKTKINDCYFDGFAGRFAITLTNGSIYSKNNVDATNNIFVGATNDGDVESLVFHKNDDALLGQVITTGWTNGNPAIKIGSASAYTGSLVTIPVMLDISAIPLSFTQLSGKITFDEHKLRFRETSIGTGTIFNNANWLVNFRHTTTDELEFISMGFSDSEINYSGVLFTITFEVAAGTDGSAAVEGLASDWTHNGAIPLVIFNGAVTYTSNQSISLIKGDATMDFQVDNWDCLAVIGHVGGHTLTDQAYLNANVNKDNRVDELDAADILFFINNNVWPASASTAVGELMFASASVDQEGLLRFPITLYNCSNVRSVEVELNYDESKVDFRNFRQLMQGDGYFVEAKSVETGKTKFFFTSAENSSGTLVPAELYFNLKSGGNTDGLITSSYSVNGAASKSGPTYGSSSITGVDAAEMIPVNFEVEQNYPNPFNPSTTIRYSLPQASYVTVKIYDILGSLVTTLVNTEMPAGKHKVIWNGDNSNGAKVVSGPYFYQVNSGTKIISKKMLLVK